MLNIINNIVDISKIEAGLMDIDLKETNVNEQIRYIYRFFKPETETNGLKLSLNESLSDNEATITTDSEKLYAILTNLVKNAIKYTEEGTIELGCSLESARETDVIKFYIKDTGIGIPKDRQGAIFERFLQDDIDDKMGRQGAGLGLAITKSYVEMLGGKIWVESEKGYGSTFYFTLPDKSEQVREKTDEQVVPVEKSEIVGKLKILIAEDDEVSKILLEETMKVFSNDILKVRTGIEAVEACRNNPDIDLVMMDIRMPKMGGFKATRQIREFNKDVIIIAQTAHCLTGEEKKSLEAGCNGYISKPIYEKDLHTIIQKHFGN